MDEVAGAAESEEERRYARRIQLRDDSHARVMVFVDGQYLYKESRRAFRHGLCHPDVLARHLAGNRQLVGVRFYTGLHDPRKYPAQHAALERRLQTMQRRGVDFHTRTLNYVWDWGPSLEVKRQLPKAGPREAPRQVEIASYERPMEKGIDLFLALDAIDLGLMDKYDVAIVISGDRDLSEMPSMLRQMVRRIRLPEIRVEAAVVARVTTRRPRRGPIVLPGYDYTHQIDEELFERAKDLTDYRTPADQASPREMPLPLEGEDS